MDRLNIAAILVALLVAVVLPCSAADEFENPETLKQRVGTGDPVLGKSKSEAELCQGCHGEKGMSITIGVPNLSGQYAGYIAKQLQDFRTNVRRHRIMTAMAEGLSDSDIPDIAAYFASQPRMKNEEPGGDQPAARELFLYGDVNRNINACVSCHDLNGTGRIAAGITYPRIAGQSKGYLRVQLLNWKIGARTNSPQSVMNKIAEALTEEEISALADYLSGL